jgi:ATP synthase protein I
VKQEPNVYRQVGRVLSLATLLPVSGFVGYGMGYYLDKWLGTGFLYIVFFLLGIAAGILQLVRELSPNNGGK